MLPDAIEYHDQYRTGCAAPACSPCVPVFVEQAAGAIGAAIRPRAQAVDGLRDRRPEGRPGPATESAILGIYICMAVLPLLFQLVAIFAILRYDLTPEKLAELRERPRARARQPEHNGAGADDGKIYCTYSGRDGQVPLRVTSHWRSRSTVVGRPSTGMLGAKSWIRRVAEGALRRLAHLRHYGVTVMSAGDGAGTGGGEKRRPVAGDMPALDTTGRGHRSTGWGPTRGLSLGFDADRVGDPCGTVRASAA